MTGRLLLLMAPALALSVSLASPLFARTRNIQRHAIGLLLALSGIVSVAAGLDGLLTPPTDVILPLGLPMLPMHLRLDALGGFFLLVIGLLVAPVGIYSVGYLRNLTRESDLTPLGIFLSLFIVGMQGVVLADDAYTFMIFWELMSVASYFLVTHEHGEEANRRAGFLYLLMAHFGGLMILGTFSILYAAGHSFEFDAMRAAELTPLWASLAFLSAGFGFGMKAGLVPLHVWLPEAHPVAPSNASALMSGVMIKVAIFGFLRVIWDLVGVDHAVWWWGGLVLAAGSSSAVGGVLLALQQHDLKRLLAYHSVENIGIIAIGLGLAMIFARFGYPALAALGLVASLYHTLNHALFKGLLFMGAGAV
ncbi:MAG: hydrogenase 4 subunit B, partial [Nitrospinae bacterium CG11_big_fil_rev_8_21_14_0_20_56_8]